MHYNFIRSVASELRFENFFPVKANVFNYLKACTRQFDIIFSDAPYDLAGSEGVVSLVFERGLLRAPGVLSEDTAIPGTVCEDGTVSEGGLLIFEHSKDKDFSGHPNFLQSRNYGSVQFSFFGAGK